MVNGGMGQWQGYLNKANLMRQELCRIRREEGVHTHDTTHSPCWGLYWQHNERSISVLWVGCCKYNTSTKNQLQFEKV